MDTVSRLTPKGAATRARIVAAGAELMFRHGVAGTSTEDVRVAARVSNSQLYHYFADKTALVHAVIDWQADAILTGQEPLLSSLDSLAALRSWRDAILAAQEKRQCSGGCPLGALSGELSGSDDVARQALADAFARWERPIREGLQRMRDRGALRPETDVACLALGTLAALQGGLLLSQAMRDVSPLRAGLDLALAQIEESAVTDS